MVIAKNLSLLILSMNQYQLKWQLEGDSEGGLFTVQRSESSGGEYEDIATIDDTENLYIDTNPLSERKYIPYYYRIKYSDNSYSNIVNSPYKLNKEVLMYIWNLERQLKRSGIRSYYFRRKRKGDYCDCWDKVLRRSVDSNCKICNGTGYIGGYYDPVEFYMFYPGDMPSIIDTGIVKYNILVPKSWTVGYPRLFPGDVIIRDIDKELFSVGNQVEIVTKQMYVVRQMIPLIAVERGSVEFNLVDRIKS